MQLTKDEYIDRLQANVPFELRARNQWVLFRLEMNKKGKVDKVPYNVRTGFGASHSNPATWAPFDEAVNAYLDGGYDLLGYAFSEDDPYTGTDLDACVVDRVINPQPLMWVCSLYSYSEFSQSETGVHIITEAKLPGSGRKNSDLGVEMYDRQRFFVFTGDHVPDTPDSIQERQEEIETLYREVFPEPVAQPVTAATQPRKANSVDDTDLWQRMFASRDGEKIRRLWNGDTSEYGGDDSAADLALCNYLAFWTNKDPERMDRLFRQSKLYRTKWERADYRKWTLDKAIVGTTDVWAGPGADRVIMEEMTAKIGDLPAMETATHTNGSAPPVDPETGILLEWPVHDHGNAAVVNALHPESFGFCDALGWMANVGTHYDTENAERMVNRAITETLIRRRMAAVEAEREDVVKGTTPSTARKNAVKDMFKDLVVVRLSDFDKDPNVLNCANGVVDLRTGQLVAHGPSNRFTYCVPTPYTPTAQSDLWNKFLAESIEAYSDIAGWLQMAVGYSITGLTWEEILFYIEGPTRSGKGTFEHTKLTLLGSPLARGVDFNTFTSKRDGDSQNFDLAPLRAARLISASESGRYSSLNEAVVKNITGNDPVTAAFKHRDMFTYTPQFKIWLSSNYPVKGDVDDDAFWGRIRVIRFPNSHLGNEDKTLKWRMASAENLPGILAWAVEGARRWYASPQGLLTPKVVEAATQKHRDELDHVQQWFDECAEPRIGNEVTNALLYTSYQNWCEENGHTPKKAAAFGRALTAKGFEACQKKIGGRPVRAYRNLALVENEGL